MAIDPTVALGFQTPKPPDALGMAGQFQGLQNAQMQNRLMGQSLETGQQALAQRRVQALGNVAASALSAYDPKNPASAQTFVNALHDGLDNAVQTGMIDQNTGQTLIHQIAATPHIEDLVARTKQFALMGLDTNTSLGRTYGTMGEQASGATTQPGVVSNPMFPRPFQPIGQPVQQKMPPSTAADLVDIKNPDGSVEQVTRAEAARRGGLNGVVEPSILGNGRIPSALLNPNAPRTVGKGPSSAQDTAQKSAGNQSAAEFGNITTIGREAVGRDALLANMQADAAKFLPGPGADGVKAFKAALNTTLARFNIKGPFDIEGIGAQEAFNKFVSVLSNAQGAGSDARMATLAAANPSAGTTEAGLKTIFAQLRGNEQYNIARAKLASKWGDQSDWRGFEANATKNLDPRAFQFATMDQGQREKFLASFKDQRDRDAMKRSYLWAHQQGLLNGS